MQKKLSLLIVLISTVILANAFPFKNDFYQLKIYHVKNNEQVSMIDDYLKNAYLPALHRAGIKNIGVFKPIANDTATDKLIYVFIPFASEAAWPGVEDKLNSDAAYIDSSKSFMEATSEKAPYVRMESILLEAFSGQPHFVIPATKNAGRVFELRSYESPTENLHKKKMAMFNTGGEIPLFNRLGFNPVFYGRVVSGSHMPNFMYMPVFESVEQRNAQWKKFGEDPVWKDISNRPENENKVSVSHIDSILMRAADYSD
ncbi:MAG: NIPSNAP family protein, partial [Ginsengibacter sp.]